MNKIKPWILASRPKTLFASLSPIIIGLSFSFYIYHSVDWLVAILTVLSAALIQIGSNYANDAYDYLKGSDDFRVGPERMAQKGVLSPHAILNMMYFIFTISVLIGFYLALVGGWPIITIAFISIVFAIIYTGGPFPLGYNGLGDLAVFIFFGLISTIGTFYLQSQALNSSSNIFEHIFPIMLISVAIGCLNTAILVVNNIRDYKSDKQSNKKTLVVFWGERFGCFEYASLLVISTFCFIMYGIIIEKYLISYLMLFNLFIIYSLIRKVFNYKNSNLNKVLEKTSQFVFFNALLFLFSTLVASL